MTKADELKFEKTSKSKAESISSSENNVSNPSTWIAESGDNVELRHNGHKIQVRDVKIKTGGILEGEIFEFTDIGAHEYSGLELNQKISFTNKHVFHVSRKNP